VKCLQKVQILSKPLGCLLFMMFLLVLAIRLQNHHLIYLSLWHYFSQDWFGFSFGILAGAMLFERLEKVTMLLSMVESTQKKIIIVTMCISGALAGLVGINELMGVQHRLFLNFNYGYGFGGIAVALMGRNHPVGILIAAFLFGILYQGGAELDFELQNVSRDIVVVMQGLVILFCGGLEYLYRPILIRFLAPIEATE